jgi:hypothetical protein
MIAFGRSALSVVVATLVALGLVGCGSKRPEGTLAGAVTYKGQPVTKGEVQFYSTLGAGATAPLDSSGRFTVDGLMPVGEYQVCVVPEILHPNPNAPKQVTKSADIPKKARDLRTSGLSIQLTEGKNDVVLELKD